MTGHPSVPEADSKSGFGMEIHVVQPLWKIFGSFPADFQSFAPDAPHVFVVVIGLRGLRFGFDWLSRVRPPVSS